MTPAIQAHGMMSEKSEANYHDILDEWKQMTASGCDSKDKTLKVAFGEKCELHRLGIVCHLSMMACTQGLVVERCPESTGTRYGAAEEAGH